MLHMALHGASERNVVIVNGDRNIGAAQDRIAAHQVVNGIVYPPVGSGLVLRKSRLRDRIDWELSCSEECASWDC